MISSSIKSHGLFLFLFLTNVYCFSSRNSVLCKQLLSDLNKVKQQDLPYVHTSMVSVPDQIMQQITKLELNQVDSKELLSFPDLWGKLTGNWELVFTNNAGQSPPSNLFFSLKKVEQRIEYLGDCGKVDNVLCYASPFQTGEVKLEHTAHVISRSTPAMLSINLESVDGIFGQRFVLLPFFPRKGFFETTYVDDILRISRGPFGEIRVFERKL